MAGRSPFLAIANYACFLFGVWKVDSGLLSQRFNTLKNNEDKLAGWKMEDSGAVTVRYVALDFFLSS